MKTDHEKESQSLIDQFKIKFEEQNKFVEELKHELTKATTQSQEYHDRLQEAIDEAKQSESTFKLREDQCNQLQNQVESLSRQLQTMNSNAACEQRTREADERRIQSLKQ